MHRIRVDLCIAKRNNQVDRFRKHWFAKPCLKQVETQPTNIVGFSGGIAQARNLIMGLA
jgi:hypothetical protein